MQEKLQFNIHIERSQQGTYFTVPFQVTEEVQSLTLEYEYPRRPQSNQVLANGVFTARPEVNIIDLGLIAPDGAQVGASGSDKTRIRVSETGSTPGYRPWRIDPGEWQILVGAYKVAPEGVTVQYTVTLERKAVRLLKGDLHTHTLASDGVHTLDELAFKARRSGLDFIAITDHNQMISPDALPQIDGVTMIPGIEWTHYQGHANFLGSARPYDGSFAANTPEEARRRFQSARERGATITINHPYEENYGFHFDLNELPFDAYEIWNGPMREANLRAVAAWHQMLCAGQKVPACGGSDYHRDTPFIFLGGPTMCVYANSNGPSDILEAVRRGRSFITFAPDGPLLNLSAGDAPLGGSVKWEEHPELQISAENLKAGDTVRVVTGARADLLFQAPADGEVELTCRMESPGFARIEILRAFLPGLPMLPALLSNPIYFEK